ncbi:MAG: chemotaxis protein CheW [Archangium sp.]|nr:chemotaxis protein CheW [Archangium sp.]MDP3156081.1 chemotaxis protein CheW [Archangium sp.]MDP3572839.1 chemotaxis protein CheW [Archangium sp.]
MPDAPAKPVADFAELYARLERAEAAWSGDDSTAQELRVRVLERRARLLALPRAADQGEVLNVMAFRVAQDQYAVRTVEMEQVLECRGMAPLPGAPAHVLGAIAARGQLIAVLDLRCLLGLESGGLSDLSWVLVVRGDDGPFGLAAEAIDGPAAVPVAELLVPDRGPFHHVTTGRMAVLALAPLLAGATGASRDAPR